MAMAMLAPLFLVVNAQAPFKTLQEMIDYGKSKPEGLTFGSPGPARNPIWPPSCCSGTPASKA